MATKPENKPKKRQVGPKVPLVAGTKRPRERRGVMVAVNFPRGYLQIIEDEGKPLGLTRGRFLSMLVKRAHGLVDVNRVAGLPSYELTEEDANERVKYMWDCDLDVRAMIDEGRLRAGRLSTHAYLQLLVNLWLGSPLGLPIIKKTR